QITYTSATKAAQTITGNFVLSGDSAKSLNLSGTTAEGRLVTGSFKDTKLSVSIYDKVATRTIAGLGGQRASYDLFDSTDTDAAKVLEFATQITYTSATKAAQTITGNFVLSGDSAKSLNLSGTTAEGRLVTGSFKDTKLSVSIYDKVATRTIAGLGGQRASYDLFDSTDTDAAKVLEF